MPGAGSGARHRGEERASGGPAGGGEREGGERTEGVGPRDVDDAVIVDAPSEKVGGGEDEQQCDHGQEQQRGRAHGIG